MARKMNRQGDSRNSATNRPARKRRGIASLLAMLYLILFSALALGFYATTNMSSQVSGNERRAIGAHIAAESAVSFLRYHLSTLDVPFSLPVATQFEEAYMQLATRLDGTGNLGGGVVGYDGNTITIPENGYVKLDPSGNQKFNIRITRAGDLLVSNFTGRSEGAIIGRAIEVRFAKATNASAIFNYGVAGRGRIATSGNSRIIGASDPTKGSVLSTSSDANPVDIQGLEVSGDISVSSTTGSVTYKSGAIIGGSTISSVINADHIHKGVPAPEFPEIDTAVYKQYATNPYVAGMKNLTNVFIPALTNPTITDATIKGVLYIYAPNKVTISGTTTIQAIIVSPTGTITNTSTNQINVIGTVTSTSVEDLPDASPFQEVRKLSGGFIIAPGFSVILGGNMGTVSGSVIASKFTMIGTASGTIRGSVIVTDNQVTQIGGTAAITIASTGTTKYPPGVTFGAHYTAIPGSYLEMMPDGVKATGTTLAALTQ